ncbi:MAG: hypothetical protein ACJ74O_11725 [Frankiaceae bacterium]
MVEWVVSLETAGDPPAAFALEVRLLMTALPDVPVAVELREHGYGTTMLIDCDEPQEALALGLRILRDAERRMGVAGLPVVSAEVTAASEVEDARVPGRGSDLDHLDHLGQP